MKTQKISAPLMSTIFLTAVAILVVHSSASAAEHTVTQKDKQFSTKTITVKKGDVVKFKNDEKDISHNVYSLGPKNAFELKTQAPGESSPVTFKEAGETEIECAIHPGMKLKVKVEDK